MNKGNQTLLWVLFLFFTLVLLTYFLFPGDINRSFPTRIAYLLVSFSPIVAIAFALKFYGLDQGHGRAYLLVLFSFIAAFIGDFIWFVFDYLNIEPFPSIADYFYILWYPFLFMGLLREWKMSSAKLSPASFASKMLMFFITFVLILLVGYFGIYLAYSSDVSFLENAVAISYSVGDLILLSLALFVLRIMNEFQGGYLFYPWLGIFVGLCLMLIADIIFSIFQVPYDEGVFSFVISLDGIWMASLLAFAYGFGSLANTIKLVQDRAKMKAT